MDGNLTHVVDPLLHACCFIFLMSQAHMINSILQQEERIIDQHIGNWEKDI